MNRQIRLVGAGLMALFIGLFVQLNYLQVIHAGAIDNNPLNGSRVVKEYTRQRGEIISADGQTLAMSVPTNDQFKYLREYPKGPLFAAVTGFFSFTYGSIGAEKAYDSTLTGANTANQLPTSISGLKNLLTNGNKSQNIVLTLSDKMQQAAADALGNKVGSVVAINPKTGAILAMYSNPSYDPNLLVGHNQPQVEANYKTLINAPGNPLSTFAYEGRTFPGSTFKILTSSAVFDHDPQLATKNYPVSSALKLPDTDLELHNFGGETCGGQLLALFTVSCNSGFGQIGLDLGATNLAAEANAFGFNKTPPIDLPGATTSVFPPPSSFAQDQPGVAYSAIGQQDVQASPLEMALVAAGIANGGTIMTPHVLDHVTNSQAQTVATYQDKPWLNATSAQTAAQMKTLMLSVVNSPDGTGAEARIPGVQVAAKTGTVQTGTGLINAWFAAFAPAQDPTIAVAVLVPNQPSGDQYQGGTISAPIAKAVIEAWLSGTAASTGGTATPGSATTTPASGG